LACKCFCSIPSVSRARSVSPRIAWGQTCLAHSRPGSPSAYGRCLPAARYAERIARNRFCRRSRRLATTLLWQRPLGPTPDLARFLFRVRVLCLPGAPAAYSSPNAQYPAGTAIGNARTNHTTMPSARMTRDPYCMDGCGSSTCCQPIYIHEWEHHHRNADGAQRPASARRPQRLTMFSCSECSKHVGASLRTR
jgi:hypothetical protein